MTASTDVSPFAELPRSRVLALADRSGLVGPLAVSEAIRNDSGEVVDFRIVAANEPAAESMHSYIGPGPGTLWSTIIPAEDFARRLPRYAALIDAGGSKFERDVVVRTVQGTTFAMDLQAAVCEGYLVTTWQDATDRLHDARARVEAEDRYGRLLEAAVEGILIIDDRGIVTFANDAAAAAFGLTVNDLIGHAASDVLARFLPEDLRAYGQMRTVERESAPMRHELRAMRDDGTEVVLLVSRTAVSRADGAFDSSIVMIHDITERTHAVEELDRIFTLSRDLVSIVRFDGSFFRVNPAYERLLGWTEEEILSMPFADLLHPDERDLPHLGLLFGGESVTIPQVRIRKKDGSYLWVEYAGIGVPDRQMIYGTARDITDRVQAEQDRLALEADRRQSQKMEAIGRLAGGVAHDFNNILTAMGGNAEFLLSGLAADDPLREDAEEIRKEVARAAALTRQLMAFSRRQSLAPGRLDLNEVLQDMERLLRRLIGADVELKTDLSHQPAYVEADRNQIEQVIVNLAVNARDAMPNGGELVLTTSCTDTHVTFVVRDSGAGMESETSARAFEPFFTTKAAGQGTGFGLSTVFGIIDQCGGRIVVDSERGRGTTFRMTFPYA